MHYNIIERARWDLKQDYIGSDRHRNQDQALGLTGPVIRIRPCGNVQ